MHGIERDPSRLEAGNVLVGVLIAIMMLAGLATPLLMRALRDQQATTNGVLASRLLAVAESGLHYNYTYLQKDNLYCVRATAAFAWNPASAEYVSTDLLLNVSGDAQKNTFSFGVSYLDAAGNPVEFADRSNPVEEFETIKVTSRAGTARVVREITAYYQYGLGDAFDGAIISDMIPDQMKVQGSKGGAKSGNLVFDGGGKNKMHAVFGDLRSNGVIVYDGRPQEELTEDNAALHFIGHRGKVRSRLSGTGDEVPDFTEIGNPKQLFDFDRFKAAALAGAGTVYPDLEVFATAVRAANAAGTKLEGIQVVLIDPSSSGNRKLDIPEGVHVSGTLLFSFAPGTPPSFKIVIQKPMHVNAASLAGLSYGDESTYPSGFPPIYADPTKKPHAVDITASGFDNFSPDDDLPAIMFDNGIVDLHWPLNISGVVYGPAFIEIENKTGGLQYINGAVIGGGGIYFQSTKAGGMIAIRHDTNTTDQLAVGERARRLRRVGYTIGR